MTDNGHNEIGKSEVPQVQQVLHQGDSANRTAGVSRVSGPSESGRDITAHGNAEGVQAVSQVDASGQVIPERDLCNVCGTHIRTLTFKGTRACSDEHFKIVYGSARSPKSWRDAPDFNS